MFIKEKIQFKGNDTKIKISLSGSNNLSGLQESINEYIERETGLSINPVIDGETFRLKNSVSSKTFTFNFYNGSTYNSSLLNAGFTNEDFENKMLYVATSFYIIQIFDSMNTENQVLLHSGFYGGFNFTNATSIYNIASSNEFANVYIEENFLDSASTNLINVYAKFFFFNAKTGTLKSFFNQSNETLTTEEKLYHTIQINRTTKKYAFTSPSGITSKELINSNYNENLNTTLDIFSNEKPTYPVGKTFTNDGTYQ